MPAPRAKPILVFDVNETLLDLTSLEPFFERLFGEAAVMREWFAQLILYSQTVTLAGGYVPFGKIALGVLRMIAATRDRDIADEDADELASLIGVMPAHADAKQSLGRLRDAGFRMVTLTNSAPGPSPSPLESAGLSSFFERAFSVDAVGRFKPDPATYQHVASELGEATSGLCLVACHIWDTIGAQSAGCFAAFVARQGNAELPAEGFPAPDVAAPDLTDLADRIIQRWGAR